MLVAPNAIDATKHPKKAPEIVVASAEWQVTLACEASKCLTQRRKIGRTVRI